MGGREVFLPERLILSGGGGSGKDKICLVLYVGEECLPTLANFDLVGAVVLVDVD